MNPFWSRAVVTFSLSLALAPLALIPSPVNVTNLSSTTGTGSNSAWPPAGAPGVPTSPPGAQPPVPPPSGTWPPSGSWLHIGSSGAVASAAAAVLQVWNQITGATAPPAMPPINPSPNPFDPFNQPTPPLALTDDQINQISAALPTLQADKQGWHWTKAELGLRWAMQGYIDQGEMNTINDIASGAGDVAGAGFYFADESNSSRSYGSFPIVAIIKKGTPIYKADVVRKIIGRDLNVNEIVQLGLRIPFINNYEGDWWNTQALQNVSELHYGGKYGARIQLSRLNGFQDILPIVQNALKGSNPYLEKLFFLSRYDDGLAFMTAMETNPGQPEAIFEPENFQNYRDTYQKYLPVVGGVSQMLNQDTQAQMNQPAITVGGTWGAGVDKDTWVANQVNSVLPQIRTGVGGGAPVDYRNEGIRAGGPEVDQSFFVTPEIAAHLQANPYLTVELSPSASGQPGNQAHYYYPDAFHFQGLKGRISDDLYSTLQTTPSATLWSNTALRQQLNHRIIVELLTELYGRFWGQTFNYHDPKCLQFMVDLISIHPYGDDNGRTVRMYFDLAGLGSGQFIPPFPLADFDLLMSPEFLAGHLSSVELPYKKMLVAYLEELMAAKEQNRTPDFAMLSKPFNQRPHSEFVRALKELGPSKTIVPTAAQIDLIKQRKFADVFNQWFPDWAEADVYSAVKAAASLQNDPVKYQAAVDALFQPEFIQQLGGYRQSALLQMAQGNVNSLKYMLMLSQYGKPLLQANLGDVIPTMVQKNPAMLQSPDFQTLLTNSVKGDSYLLYQWLFSDTVFSTPMAQAALQGWIDATKAKVAKITAKTQKNPNARKQISDFNTAVAGSNFMRALTESKKLATPAGQAYMVKLLGTGTQAIDDSFQNAMFSSIPTDFWKTDTAFQVTQELIADANSTSAQTSAGAILSAGVQPNDPRWSPIIAASVAGSPSSQKVAVQLFAAPGYLTDPAHQALFNSVATASLKTPDALGGIWQGFIRGPFTNPPQCVEDFMFAAAASSSTNAQYVAAEIFASHTSPDYFTKNGPKLVAAIRSNGNATPSTLGIALIGYGLNADSKDPNFWPTLQGVDPKTLIALIGSKNVAGTPFEATLVAALKTSMNTPSGAVDILFSPEDYMSDAAYMNYLNRITPYLRTDLVNEAVSITSSKPIEITAPFFIAAIGIKDTMTDVSLMMDLVPNAIQAAKPAYLQVIQHFVSDPLARQTFLSMLDSSGFGPGLLTPASKPVLQTLITSFAGTPDSMTFWQSWLLPNFVNHATLNDAVTSWIRTNWKNLSSDQRFTVLNSDATLMHAGMASTVRAEIIAKQLTPVQIKAIGDLLNKPQAQNSPYRKQILDAITRAANPPVLHANLVKAMAPTHSAAPSCKTVAE